MYVTGCRSSWSKPWSGLHSFSTGPTHVSSGCGFRQMCFLSSKFTRFYEVLVKQLNQGWVSPSPWESRVESVHPLGSTSRNAVVFQEIWVHILQVLKSQKSWWALNRTHPRVLACTCSKGKIVGWPKRVWSWGACLGLSKLHTFLQHHFHVMFMDPMKTVVHNNMWPLFALWYHAYRRKM
jgi:hypothetical protein